MGTVRSTTRPSSTKSTTSSTPHEVTYGALPSTTGPVTFYRFPAAADALLPSRVDLREPGGGCYPYPLIQEQNQLSNCSSAATVAAFQCVQRKTQAPQHWIKPSVLYNYYYARYLSGNTDLDAGASLEAALQAMMVGVATESAWPFQPQRVNTTPTVAAQIDAQRHAVSQWDRLEPTLRNLKTTLSAGYPVLFAFVVTQEMDRWFKDRNQQIASGFTIPIEEFALSTVVAAHSVTIVAYDDAYLNVGAFLCRNSWGPRFGLDGHFWFPYASVLFPDLTSAFFVIRQVCSVSQGTCVSAQDCSNVYSPSVCQGS